MNISRFIKYSYSIIISISLLIGVVQVEPASAASPSPKSSLIDAFVLVTDNIYGYKAFIPANWKSVDFGDRRGYYPINSESDPNRIVLAFTNFATISSILAGQNGLVPNYELFRQDPSLGPWTTKIEGLWSRLGIKFNIISQMPEARIYLVNPSPDQLQLIGYIVDQGEPLGVSLNGLGVFNNIEIIKDSGLLKDFETIVASATVALKSSSPTLYEKVPTQSISPNITYYYGDSGYLSYGVYTYRMQDLYYNAPPLVYWLYEYMYYGGPEGHDTWLYNTSVTDDPTYTCVYGGGYLYFRTIWEAADPSTHIVTDSYTPNQVVNHLNTTTAHMIVFGDPLAVLCLTYYPYTH